MKKGAEADLYLIDWVGLPAVKKVRVSKSYLQPKLDQALRTYRTSHEALFLKKARECGVLTPVVYYVDPKGAELIMQFIEGIRLKELLLSRAYDECLKLCEQMGKVIALLHQGDIMHSDLTPSNFILSKKGLVVIDFGLSFTSKKIEDRAVDLHLLKSVLLSTYTDKADAFFNSVLNGYSSILGAEVVNILKVKIREIERRGRYARVV
ncbi:MAG: KEOPS complex kinase/ATPase Bud32 [Nitrososphaerales archaeon]